MGASGTIQWIKNILALICSIILEICLIDEENSDHFTKKSDLAKYLR